jgi:N-methylhydantoinase B
MNLVNIGTRTRDGSAFTNLVETYAGGQGGHPGQDGMDGVQTHMTNTKNAPVEILEGTYPLRVLGYGLRAGTGGVGRYRGGCGVWRRYRLESDSAMVTLSSDRAVRRPWGLWGGGPGSPSRCRVWEDGRLRRIQSKASFRIRRGAELLIETPGGGGWGDPAERDAGAADRDRRSGLARWAGRS